jgi:hypothetical protein
MWRIFDLELLLGAVKLCSSDKIQLQDWESGIPIDSLPKTIQQAIHLTRLLGFKWLWVDACYIIQDDEEDWIREASSMANAYQNCFLSLAALGASSSSEGLFSQRDPLVYQSCQMVCREEGNNIYGKPHRALYAATKHCFLELPLHKREWAVQERLLPPRTLNFGAFLIWDCRRMFADEFNSISAEKKFIKTHATTLVGGIKSRHP